MRPLRSSLVVLAVAALAVTADVGTVRAQATPGFDAASSAWDRGAFAEAGAAYERTIDAGGLGPVEVVLAHTRIGIARALVGKRDLALSAFRTASTIDPSFELPPDASPKARAPYEQARKEAASRGRLTLKLSAPDKIPHGKVFTVKIELSDESAALVDKIEIDVSDPLTKKSSHSYAQAVAEQVSFEVPAKAAVPGATLLISARALDTKGNRWVVQEARVSVAPAETGPKPATGPLEDDVPPKKASKGFFSKPWPYVIGGGVLLAGGVSTFLLLRGNDRASVGAPAWTDR